MYWLHELREQSLQLRSAANVPFFVHSVTGAAKRASVRWPWIAGLANSRGRPCLFQRRGWRAQLIVDGKGHDIDGQVCGAAGWLHAGAE